MPKRLKATTLSLPELLLSEPAFALPPSQRVYGWGELQLDGLFRDIKADAFAAAPPVGPPADHWFFFGIVYLANDAASGLTFIADGQQRVVTGTMIFAVARDLATDPDERARYHTYVASAGGSYRLRLRDVDADFFRIWVQEPGATKRPYAPETDETVDADGSIQPLSESQSNILTNRNLIIERLSALGADGRRRLLDYLDRCSELVVITAAALDDATAAYASTYKRGLSQATTDRLKSECLGDADPQRRSHLGNHWDECEALLGKEGLEDLLYLMTIERTRSAALGDLQGEVLREFNLPADVASFIVQELVPAAEVYRYVVHPANGLDKFLDPGLRHRGRARKITDHLTVLKRTSHIEWRLPAYVALHTFRNDIPLLEMTLHRLERLAAAHMIIGQDPQAAIVKYAGLVDAIRLKNAGAIHAASEVDRAVLTKIRPALEATTFATKSRLRMPVLLKINDLMEGRVVDFDPADVSCEHVLPQSVGKQHREWHQAFRSPDGKRYNGAHHRHRLGNVAILSHKLNREAGSRPFAEKRPLLSQSEHAIARDCGKYPQWTADVIDERTTRLINMLMKHWEF